MSRPLSILAVPALVLALAACGDDGPSREDYIADADAICERLNEEFQDVQRSRPTTIVELREQLDAGIELTEEGLDEFEELEVPEELEDEVDEFLDAAREQGEILEEARNADSLEQAGQILREKVPPITERRREAADDIGFEECGSGSS